MDRSFSRLTSRFKQHFSTDSNFTRKLRYFPPLAGHMHVHVTLLAHDQLRDPRSDPVRRPLRIPLIRTAVDYILRSGSFINVTIGPWGLVSTLWSIRERWGVHQGDISRPVCTVSSLMRLGLVPRGPTSLLVSFPDDFSLCGGNRQNEKSGHAIARDY